MRGLTAQASGTPVRPPEVVGRCGLRVVRLPLVPSWQQRLFLGTKHPKVVVDSRAHVLLITLRRCVHGDPPPQNSSNRSCISFLVPPSDVLLTLLYPTLSLSLPLSIYLYLSLHRPYSCDIL